MPAADPRAALKEGIAAREAGNLSKARARFEQAVAAWPTWVLARLELADTLLHMGASDDLVGQHLEAARLIDPDNPRLSFLLGLHHELGGHPQQAAAAFERAIELRPSLLDVRLRLGRLLLDEGKAREAVLHLSTFVGARPESLSGRALLAQALEASGDLSGAEIALRAAASRFPENPYHWRRLIAFYERHGLERQARKARASAEKHAPRARRDLRPLPKSRR